MTTPQFTLNDGSTIPALGFGVFLVPPEETQRAVEYALEVGYRHIDTASIYGNEEGVGRAIAASDLDRRDIFLTTKLWNADQGSARVRPALEASLERLGVDFVDLYLIHWPVPSRDLYVESWQELERAADEGLARLIGVSNFLPEHLQRLADLGGRIPVVNQVELHPTFQQRDVCAANERLGVVTQAWSPLGRGAALELPAIVEAAASVGATPAQVVLAWHLARGRVVIPKSVTPSRIVENLAAAELSIAPSILDNLDSLDSGGRIGPDPASFEG